MPCRPLTSAEKYQGSTDDEGDGGGDGGLPHPELQYTSEMVPWSEHGHSSAGGSLATPIQSQGGMRAVDSVDTRPPVVRVADHSAHELPAQAAVKEAQARAQVRLHSLRMARYPYGSHK